MKRRLDMEKIANGLGAERRRKVVAGGGWFGAAQLAADVQARLRVPAGGGRPTDPDWTERRLVPLAPETLEKLEELAALIRARTGTSIEPMQIAALLLERAAERLDEDDVAQLTGTRQAHG